MAINFLNTVAVDENVLFVDAANNRVGVGTSTPGSVLDVQGSQGQLFSITDDLSGDIFAVSDISGVPIMTVNSSGVSYFDGKVGIGIDNPTVTLQVDGDAYIGTGATDDNLSLRVYGNNAGASRYLELAHTNASSSRVKTNNSYLSLESAGYILLSNSGLFYGDTLILNNKRIKYGESNGGWRDVMYLGTDNVFKIGTISTMSSGGDTAMYHSGSEKVRINSTGVGIGTTSPNEKLEVAGKVYIESQGVDWNETTPGLVRGALHLDPVGNGADDTGNAITFGASDRLTGTNAQAGIYTRSDGAYGTKMYFATTDQYTAGSKTRVMIDYNGNVGIGTTSPIAPLHVLDDSSANVLAKIRIQGGSTSGYGDIGMQSGYIRLFSNGSMCSAWTGGTQYNYINGSTASTLNSNGLGINTTSPDFRLDVDGTFGVSDLPFNTDSVSVLVADETIGAELITNGNFATDSDWSKGPGWTISGGTANAVSATSEPMAQTVSGFAAGNIYKVRFEVTAVTNGYIRVYAYEGASGTFTNIFNSPELTTGVYESTFEFGGTNKILRFYGSTGSVGGFAGSIDNVSVKQVTSASNQIQKRELGTGAFGPTPVGAYLPLAGGTMTAGAVVNFLASSGSTDDRLKFGTAGQMQLFHDGSDGYIINSLGDVRMDVNVFRIRSSNGTETMIKATQNDNVELYFNDVRKLRTTVGGVFVEGEIKIDSALLDLQENTDIDSAAAEVVAQVAHATYTAAFFDFVVKKGTNVRSGTVYACHNGDTTPLVEFTETSTNDLGDTSDVTLSVDISGANMRLLATVTSDDWSVKSLIRAI